MAKNVRQMLNDFTGGLQQLGGEVPDFINSFMSLLGATYKEGELSVKNKELLSLQISGIPCWG